MKNSIDHLNTLHSTFVQESNFLEDEKKDYWLYKENFEKFSYIISELGINTQLYGQKDRQMILADMLEYIFLGRGYYSIKTIEDKQKFTKSILYFVNLLMCYESMTYYNNIRIKYLTQLKTNIPKIETEEPFIDLIKFQGSVG